MFSNPNEFSLHIELLKKPDSTYIETILDYCEENFIDVEDIAILINKTLKDKIANEIKINPNISLDGF